MGDLSAHFSRWEFACKGSRCCGHTAAVVPELIEALELLRAEVGHAIAINSGFRCITHNNNVGGASESYHCRGMAADISCSGIGPGKLAAIAATVPAFRDGGIGVYDDWVHVDVRDGVARWHN